MTPSRKLQACFAVIALLVIVIAAMAYKFIVAGSTGETRDGRTVVLVTPAERLFMLNEMRGLFAGVPGLAGALAREDFAQAAKLARSLGSDPDSAQAATLMGKLPLDFKALGLSLDSDFERMAKALETGEAKDSKGVLRQLSGTLQKCVACHARYQLGVPAAQAPSLGMRLAAQPR